jgi:hypothetical protein
MNAELSGDLMRWLFRIGYTFDAHKLRYWIFIPKTNDVPETDIFSPSGNLPVTL